MDHHGTLGVGDAVLADRAEHEAGERTVASAGHHQEGGVARRLDEHLTGPAFDHVGVDGRVRMCSVLTRATTGSSMAWASAAGS